MSKIIPVEIPDIVEYINNNKIKGDHQLIAEKCGCSVNTVYAILQNPNISDLSIKILENFVRMLQNRIEKVVEVNEKISNQ
jgi:DNA invertase Pin-like site-specific DNA recombinase